MINFCLDNIRNNLLFGFLGIFIMFLLKKTIFKKFSQKFNYYIWLPLMITMAIPLKVTITRKVYTPFQNEIKKINFLNQEVINTTTYEKGIINYIGIIYISIVILIITLRLTKYFIFRKKVIKESIVINDKEIINIFNKARCDLNIKKNYSLKINKKLSTPINIGILKPEVIIPNEKYTDKELELIFKHELIHYKRHDFFYKLFIIIVSAINFINPLVYFMTKDINYYCESSCDEEVVKISTKEDVKIYSMVIAKTALEEKYKINRALSFSLNEKSITVKRIKTMFDEKKKFKGNITLFIASLLIILSFGVLILNIEYVAVQASENKNIINSEEINENNEVENLEELKDIESLTKFLKERIMVSGDKKILKSFLEDNNIEYNEEGEKIKFGYKKWSISINYYKNYLKIEEK